MSTATKQASRTANTRPDRATGIIPAPKAREQFIPLRKAELVEALAGNPELTAAQAADFRRFCQLVQGLVHRQFQTTLEALKDAYAPFDPDADTQSEIALSEAELEERRQTLFEKFSWLLERGNFVRLAHQEIEEALADCSQWGLNLSIDFEIFDRLEIYRRGDIVGTRYRRRLRKRFQPEAVEVPIFQRLVVIFRLRPGRLSKFLDTQDVYIKLFKDIPKADLDMLLPETQVKMSLVDRAKILLPTLSGVSIAIWKIVQGALIVATAGIYGSLAFLGLIGGTVGYGVRSFYGYLNTKQKYQLNLTQSLYYQNLDNNAGAIYRLLDEAEEQENREAMLAYFYLWNVAQPAGWTVAQLDSEIEAFLRERSGQDIDFEIADALAKLERLQLVETSSGEIKRAVPIDRAIQTLEKCWAALPD
jgi:hypothetical protein